MKGAEDPEFTSKVANLTSRVHRHTNIRKYGIYSVLGQTQLGYVCMVVLSIITAAYFSHTPVGSVRKPTSNEPGVVYAA